ncbi:hypothetical protein SAMN05216436_118102 [bacterium A37T11]|nr:hypothetical protein SAMN05216436_118102 [bacterium A37T11]
MMTSRARLVVLIVALGMLVWIIKERSYQVAMLVAAGILYLIWSHFREGTVLMASEAFKKKQYHKARLLLADIKHPEYLRKRRRNYYEFINGSLALQLLDYEAAEHHFQIASRLPFRRPNDKAIILVHLANLNLRKNDYDRVKAYVDVARKLEVSSRIAQIINKIENEIPKE